MFGIDWKKISAFLLKLTDVLPFGKQIKWLIENLGWGGLVGFIVAAGLVFFGFYPERLVSQKFKGKQEQVLREKPDNLQIQYKPVSQKAVWISDDVYWLTQEGEREKKSGQFLYQQVAVVESQPFSKSAQEFIWILQADPSYSLSCRLAVRKGKSNEGLEIFEPLKITKHIQDSAHTAEIKVSKCEKDDSLIAIFRVGSRTPFNQALAGIVRSSIQ